jgi:hypothetical protein
MWRAALLVCLIGCGKHINPAWCEVPGHDDPACDRLVVTDAALDGSDAAPAIACTTDDQCASTVCSVAGTCIDPGNLLYASVAGTGNTCTADAPCTLAVAIAGATIGRSIVALAPGTYTDGVTISRPVTLLGRQATLQGPARGDAVTITGSAAVELDFVTITGAARGAGISCVNGSLAAHRITVNGNQQGISSACGLTLDRSVVSRNPGGALEITAGAIDIRNNFLVGNGDSMLSKTANVVIVDGVTGAFAFNTVAYNDSKQNGNPGVSCDSAGVTAAGNLITDNTRKETFNSDPQVTGKCSFAGSYLQPGGGANDQQWVSVDSLDFHLTAASTLAVDLAGASCDGNPVDFDGDPRPAGAGCDYGADELKRP